MMVLSMTILVVWAIFMAWINVFVNQGNQVDLVPIADAKRLKVTVLISCRNEIGKLQQCFDSLEQQTFQGVFDLVIVDDHSDDGSYEWIQQNASDFHRFTTRLFSSSGHGKKAALRLALDNTDADFLYFTDADCVLSPSTLETMLSIMISQHVEAVFGPVLYLQHGLWNRLLAYEQLNTQVITGAFLKSGVAMSANGGNMLIAKSLKLSYSLALTANHAGGDDVFFAQGLIPKQFSPAFLSEAVVTTAAPQTLAALVQQRVRWGSKFSAYKSWVAKAIPVFVFSVSSGFVVILLSAIAGIVPWHVFLFVWTVKWLIEFAFHHHWFHPYGFGPRLPEGLLMSTLYPLYFVVVGVLSVTSTKYQWKGRNVTTATL